MKLSVAQLQPLKADINANIETQLKLINIAADSGAELILFPELSLTGYEPALAAELAVDPHDSRFDVFQQLSDTRRITIATGMPVRSEKGIHISLLIFQPGELRQIYSKKYLHEDEEPYFASGESTISLLKNEIALAICYEVSIPQHSQDAVRKGAKIYMASVAKTEEGMNRATATLSEIARTYSIPVLLSNCTGYCDNFMSAGRSSVWNKNGELFAQLDNAETGILTYDTETGQVQIIV